MSADYSRRDVQTYVVIESRIDKRNAINQHVRLIFQGKKAPGRRVRGQKRRLTPGLGR
jgi:hypothetical protein